MSQLHFTTVAQRVRYLCPGRSCVLLACLLLATARAEESVVAIDLGPPIQTAEPTAADWRSAVALDRFYLASGEEVPTTPTAVAITWNNTALFVRFDCADPDPVVRDGTRLRRTDRGEFSIVPNRGDPASLREYAVEGDGTVTLRYHGHTAPFTGVRSGRSDTGWWAELTIPWSELGGTPNAPFAVQFGRFRWITGERLSPSAVDYHDRGMAPDAMPAAVDTFIEARLGGGKAVHRAGAGLITLPSGLQRWQRRTVLHHADEAERMRLAGLQRELASVPTNAANFAARVADAETWYDLLDQEGFSFHPESGCWILNAGELDPWAARRAINDALACGDRPAAWAALDSLLRHFDRVTKDWFADHSPGDVNREEWEAIGAIDRVESTKDRVVLHAATPKHGCDLAITFPSCGGIRICGDPAGYFSPAALLPVQTGKMSGAVRAQAGSLAVVVTPGTEWKIDFFHGERGFWRLRPGDLQIRCEPGRGVWGVALGGDLAPDESIFGLGERFDSLNQRGKAVTLWQLDAWDCLFRGGLRNQAYKPIPLWHSTAGYSVFWNSTYQIRADFGWEVRDRYRIVAHGPIFDCYVWPGSPDRTLRNYAELTGKPLLPPAWAFAPWMGGGGRRWARQKEKSSTQAILDEVSHFAVEDIPHSAVYAEGVASSDALLYRKLTPLNLRVLSWARSQPLGWNDEMIAAAFPALPRDLLPVMRLSDGKVFGGPSGHILAKQFPYIDFTDPNGLELLRAYWKPRLDLGVAGTMVDFGDLVPRDARFFDGTGGEQMHNWYARAYHRAEHHMFLDRRGEDHILFSRGASPGSQTDVSQMAGDHGSNFIGLRESLNGALSISLSGFSNWGGDIGGYEGMPDEEVYFRWVEFGAFSPLMRFHGTMPREPWYVSSAAVAMYQKYAWVRESLVPYLYGSAQDTHATGVPLMRPMLRADNQYLLGDALLIAPVVAPGGHRTIRLPAGEWTDLWTGREVTGGEHDVDVPLTEIPVYLSAGALLPLELAPDLVLGHSMSHGRVPALVVTPPTDVATSHQWTLPGHSAVTRLVSRPLPNGFAIGVSEWPELRYLLICGLQGKPVQAEVDGELLPRVDKLPEDSMPVGWQQIDPSRVIIRLPANRSHEISIVTK